VDSIEGLSPAISIEQKSTGHNPRSTVGTITEIHDYLRLLFARIGDPTCYKCGRPITRQTVQEITDKIMELPAGTKFQILSPSSQRERASTGKCRKIEQRRVCARAGGLRYVFPRR